MGSQAAGGVFARAEQQIQRGAETVLHGRPHGPASSILVMQTPGLGSMRTVCVASVPVLWTLTRPGGPVFGTARTFGSGADGGCERSRRRRTASVAAAAAAAKMAAASKMSSAPAIFDVTGFPWSDRLTSEAAA